MNFIKNQTTDAIDTSHGTPTKSTFFESVREKMGGFIDYIKSDGKDNPQMTRRDMFGVLAGAGIGLSGCAVTGVNTITDDDLHKFMQKHNIQLPGVQRDGTWVAVGKGKSYEEAAGKARTELAERGFTESGTPTVEPLGKEKWIVMVKGVKNVAPEADVSSIGEPSDNEPYELEFEQKEKITKYIKFYKLYLRVVNLAKKYLDPKKAKKLETLIIEKIQILQYVLSKQLTAGGLKRSVKRVEEIGSEMAPLTKLVEQAINNNPILARQLCKMDDSYEWDDVKKKCVINAD